MIERNEVSPFITENLYYLRTPLNNAKKLREDSSWIEIYTADQAEKQSLKKIYREMSTFLF